MNELSITREPLTAVQIREQVNLIQEVMREVMQEGQHYGTIPGCGDKKTLLKPGAEKLSMVFRLRPIMDNDHDIRTVDLPRDHREVHVYCHVLNITGMELATGIGMCSTMESKYRYRGGEKKPTPNPVPTEYWNLKKDGKMPQAQELLGGRSFAPGKVDGKWVICEVGDKIENPDIADTFNTVLKMAKKRAYVDGILSATGASDIFVQDIEDLPEDMIRKEPEVDAKEKKPTAAPPKSTEEIKGNFVSIPRAKRFYAIAKGSNMPDEEINKWLMYNYEIGSSKEIPLAKYDEICTAVGKWKAPSDA